MQLRPAPASRCRAAPCSDSLSLRLLRYNGLTLLHPVTHRLIMQKARGHPALRLRGAQAPTACRHVVSGPFHSPPGVLFTFPSRYCFTIGHGGVFSLRRWSSKIPTGYVSCGTWVLGPGRPLFFRLRDYHPLWYPFPRTSARRRFCNSPTRLRSGQTKPHNPGCTTHAGFNVQPVWAVPFSLAATEGIAVAFSSWGY
jgi:hypothetical protein